MSRAPHPVSIHLDPAGVRRILVRSTNWVGDVVMCTPALRAIRRRFPQAEVVLMARAGVAEAYTRHAAVDRVVRYEPRGEHRTLASRWALARALRREHFDLAVLFPRSFSAALWAWLAGARRRVGHRDDARAWLLTDRLPRVDFRAPRHHVEVFFDLARALGVEGDPGPLDYPLRPEERAAARRLLEEAGDDGGRPRVAIHPGVSKTPRGWHAGRWRALAGRLARERGARVIVLGGPAEAPLAAEIAAAAAPLGTSLAGGTALPESAALMEMCDLLVANDSGAMHLAAAVGTPVVAIFGPGSPEKTGPWADPSSVEVITHRFPCSPCRQDFFRECDPAPSGKPCCIESVTVDEVWEACRRQLARGRGDRAAAPA